MVFSSIPFIFFFMPLFFALYYLVPFKAKNRIILIFSLVFYAWGEVKCLPLMLFVAFTDYAHVRLSDHLKATGALKRLLLVVALVIDLSLLFYFKYTNFLVDIINSLSGAGLPIPAVDSPNIALPVGISFFTFQSMSYSMDFYRGDVEAENNYLDYLTYVSMFPQLVAGPIVRYADIKQALHKRHIGINDFSIGVLRFSMGLFKKVLLANQIGKLWDIALGIITGTGGSYGLIGGSMAFAWLGSLSFTLQLYFDFSAYSDMAIGMGQMMGFAFPENFRYPLSAVSITDFWRKWHISLSTWFRDSVYIPLGGNRRGVLRHLRNIFIVWFLTGLWHGASFNFILWGLWHGCFLAMEKYIWGPVLERLPGVLKHLYTLFIVVTGFTLFAVDDLKSLFIYIRAMAGFGIPDAGFSFLGMGFIWYLKNYAILLLIGLLLAFPLYEWVVNRLRLIKKMESPLRILPKALYPLKCLAFIILFIASVAFLVSDSYNPFLYFRF